MGLQRDKGLRKAFFNKVAGAVRGEGGEHVTEMKANTRHDKHCGRAKFVSGSTKSAAMPMTLKGVFGVGCCHGELLLLGLSF